MCKLSSLILLVFAFLWAGAQSPHGNAFEIDCANCHSPESWEWLKEKGAFDHQQTRFRLEGAHLATDCKSCHQSLVFSAASPECVSCHTDMHQNTLGADCRRCHTPQNWMVTKISQMHQQSRFALTGAHATADCMQCHNSASQLVFEPLDVECYSCHLNDYLATSSPNHQQAGYSTDCVECHGARAISWSAANFEHDFFPLSGGHAISCLQCHTSGTFTALPTDCYSCHQSDYTATTDPNHQQVGFSTDCTQCHTTTPGWEASAFKEHDSRYFPIYSGSHNGRWQSCTECHTTPASYAAFSCINCHEHNQTETDGRHREVGNYSYQSNACYSCHPTGRAGD